MEDTQPLDNAYYVEGVELSVTWLKSENIYK